VGAGAANAGRPHTARLAPVAARSERRLKFSMSLGPVVDAVA
jgi:hypothetical protein